MKVTHRQLKEGHHLSFAECFTMEYRLALRSMVYYIWLILYIVLNYKFTKIVIS